MVPLQLVVVPPLVGEVAEHVGLAHLPHARDLLLEEDVEHTQRLGIAVGARKRHAARGRKLFALLAGVLIKVVLPQLGLDCIT